MNGVQELVPNQQIAPPAGTSERLMCLLDVAQVINSSLELDAVLEHILTHAREILQAESGSIMLVEEATRQLRVHAAHGPRAAEIRGRSRRLGEGVAGWVALNNKPLLLHGPASHGPFKRACRRDDLRDALCVPLRAESGVLGVISLSNRLSAEPFTGDDLDLLTALSNQAAVAIRNARSFQEMRRQRKTVERLLCEVTHAQEEERKRVALLIHDGPAQTMYAALRNLEMARAVSGGNQPELSGAMGELEHSIRQAIAETRSLMVDLRPPCLDEMGLPSALKQYAQQFEQRTGIRAQVVHQGLPRRLPGVVESSFYRITQEALTNVWKHAAAGSVRVVLEVTRRHCSLEISDDGQGFDPATVSADESQHLGMVSLRDRTELTGGRLTVTSTPGQGTSVRVSVPLAD